MATATAPERKWARQYETIYILRPTVDGAAAETTLFVLFALFYFGGELIHNFALALIIGVVVGTTSSIYVAANIILGMKISREDLMQKVKVEGVDEFDGLP